MRVPEEAKVQAIVLALSDEYSRKIINGSTMCAKTAEELSAELGIPVSTCYRRIHDLFLSSLLRINRIERSDGKKHIFYKSAYRQISIKLDSGKISVEVALNSMIPEDTLASMWQDLWNVDGGPVSSKSAIPQLVAIT
jgi:hypothetical protein